MTLRFQRNAARGLVALAWLGLGCNPSKFDDIAGGGQQSDDAAVSVGGDGATEGAPDDTTRPLDGGLDGSAPVAPPPDASVSQEPDAGDAGCPAPPMGGRPLAVVGTPVELARLTSPSSIASRVLGPTSTVDGRRVWIFAGTGVAGGAMLPADAPMNLPTSALTSEDRPWSRPLDPKAPWRLSELLSPGGVPRPLLTLSPSEQGTGMNLTPTSLVSKDKDDATGLLFVQASHFFGAPEAVYLADLEKPDGSAVRRAEPLFKKPDPMFSLAAHRSTALKVFACERPEGAYGARCVIARAPLDRIDQRSAYEVYGKDAQGKWTWMSDLTKGEAVLDDVGDDFSLSWNEHLGKYLSVSSVPLANAVRLRTAAAPEGPWSTPVDLPLPPSRVFVTLRAREQPGLAQSCERRIVISYWSPTTAPDAMSLPTAGEIVLSAIELQ